MTIGQKIKLKRASLSLSQEQLAHLLNTSRQTIYHWENDITSPNMNDLQKLVSALQTDYDYFFKNTPDHEINNVDEVVSDIYRGVKRHWRKAYISLFISGGLFTGMGILIRIIFGMMFPSPEIPDEINGTPVTTNVFGPAGIFKALSSFIIGIGLLLIIGGIILFIKDRKKQKEYM